MNASDTYYCPGPLAGLSSLLLGTLPQTDPQEMLELGDFNFESAPAEADPFQTCDFGEFRLVE